MEQIAPVLLVDDMFDSGWTMTIATALLRQAGSGPVYPYALAATTAKQDGITSMNEILTKSSSPDTEAILLLCGRFSSEQGERNAPLTQKESGSRLGWRKGRPKAG